MNSQASTPSTTKEKELSPFEQIEAETLLNIVTQLPDLLSLHDLIHASPAVYRLFEEYGAHIFDSISKIDPIAEQSLEIICTIAFIRSGTLPVQSLDDFTRQVIVQSRQQRKSNEAFVPKSLPQRISPRILRSLLASMCQISYLTQDCLKHYLDRFMAIQPEQLKDPRFIYHHEYGPELRIVPAWDRRPEGQKYELPHQGPPCWSEEQRVSYAFWCVLSFYDLKTAAGISKLNWPKKDLEKLLAMGPLDFFADLQGVPALRDEEVLTILEYIQEMLTDDTSINKINWKSLTALRRSKVRRYWPAPSPPENPRERKRIILPTSSLTMFKSLSCDDWSPLKNVSFRSFRKLGFALWSPQRMVASGFYYPDSRDKTQHRRSPDDYYFTWRSILSTEEVEEVERLLREKTRHRGPL